MVVLQRLRLQSLTKSRQAQAILPVMLSLWMWGMSRRLHEAGQTVGQPNPKMRTTPRIALVVGMTWNVWIALCCLASAPAAVFAAIKAVPGALGLHPVVLFIVNATVALLTALSTSVLLPRLARLLCNSTKSR
eukprot:5711372-Amphidinium_carterae.1